MSPHFGIHPTPLPHVKLIERTRLVDSRGYLERLFCMNDLAEAGWKKPIAQINHTDTARRGILRGLPFHGLLRFPRCPLVTQNIRSWTRILEESCCEVPSLRLPLDSHFLGSRFSASIQCLSHLREGEIARNLVPSPALGLRTLLAGPD